MTNAYTQRTALVPMLKQIMSTDEGQTDLAKFISEVADELRILGLQAAARERNGCSCCICQEAKHEGRTITAIEREQLFAAMRSAC